MTNNIQGNSYKVISWFLNRNSTSQKGLKVKNHQPRILYPVRLSFRFDGEIKSFTDKQKLREFNTTKPALQQMLKEI